MTNHPRLTNAVADAAAILRKLRAHIGLGNCLGRINDRETFYDSHCERCLNLVDELCLARRRARRLMEPRLLNGGKRR